MEKTPENLPKPLELIDNFALKQEIARIAAFEKNRKDEEDPHFKNMNPADLNEADLLIYKKFKEGSLQKEEFDKWTEGIGKEISNLLEEEKKKVSRFSSIIPEASRKYFAAWLSNRILNWESYRNFFDYGGEITEWYPGGKPKKWLVGKRPVKQETEFIHPAGIDKKSIMMFTDNKGRLCAENPDEELREEYKRWAGIGPE